MSLRIYPVRVTLDGETGVTLWAPEWRDARGDQWTAFLGNDEHVYLFETEDRLLSWVAENTHTGLEDHPDWDAFRPGLSASDLRDADTVDLDAMFDAFGQEPTSDSCSGISRRVQLAHALAAACDDDAVTSVLDRESYEELAALGFAAGDLPTRHIWDFWGAEIAESWGWVLEQTARHIAIVSADESTRPLEPGPTEPWRTKSAQPREVIEVEPLPSVSGTVLITFLFSVFGVIPAALASAQASRSGRPTSRYWRAFGITLLIEVVILVIIGVVNASG